MGMVSNEQANQNIVLKDIIGLSDADLKNTKIRLINNHENVNVIDLFLNSPEEINTNWLFWNYSRAEFKEGQIIIGLCRLENGGDFYLLTTVKRITKDLNVRNGIAYEGIELTEYKKYYGRVIVKYHNTVQNMVRWADKLIEEIEVSEILSSFYEGKNFPGYDKVCLKYNELRTIIENNKTDWVNALSNQKAVYLITDLFTGKLYVGSATSDKGMLLDRWKNYASNGHGGNKELKEIVEKQGFDYVKQNFQYTIIENYNAKIEDKVILERESYWKEALDSRIHGMNCN
jgi:hypothetical protein